MDFGGFLARFGEIWEVVPGWPVPHSVWDYAAGVDRFSIDLGSIWGGFGMDLWDILVTFSRFSSFSTPIIPFDAE